MGSCVTTTENNHEDEKKEHQQIANKEKIEQYQQLLNEEQIDIDLTIYKQDNTNGTNGCGDKGDDDPIESCPALKGIVFGLKHYESLNILNNKKHNDMFMNFINRYNGIHLINHHNQHLYKINQGLIQNNTFTSCSINNCTFSARHHDVNNNENENNGELDQTLNFFKQTMDSLHFYLFHLWDTALRVVDNEENIDDDDSDQPQEEKKGDNEESILMLNSIVYIK